MNVGTSDGSSSSNDSNAVIRIGDWCLFRVDPEFSKNLPSTPNIVENILCGSILSFRYVEGKTKKEKQYYFDFANVNENIEASSSWYMLRTDGTLVVFGNQSNFFIKTKFYVGTTTPPKFVDNSLQIDTKSMI